VVLQKESRGTIFFAKHSEQLNLLGQLAQVCAEKDSYVFMNFMPATNGTLGTLENFVSQTPIGSVAQSPYYGTLFSTATALPFLHHRYETSFVTGAKLGWRNINNYIPAQGFQCVEGQEFIAENNPKVVTNLWGAFDGAMFDRIFERLERSTAPQYIFGMSTTNHTPYLIPDDYQALPLVIDDSVRKALRPTVDIQNVVMKNFRSYQYACHVLGEFIQKVKDSPFAQSTIVVASGDHNNRQAFNFDDGQLYWAYSVPMVAYIPQRYLEHRAAQKPLDSKQWAWQSDIFPTLYELALSNATYTKLGRDLLSDTTAAYAVNAYNRVFGEDGVCDMGQNLYFGWGESRYLHPAPELSENARLQKICKSAQALHHLKVYLEYANTSQQPLPAMGERSQR
jgi:phosphoglycerol transferase MdoB-like AlkP superfamily enzyme